MPDIRAHIEDLGVGQFAERLVGKASFPPTDVKAAVGGDKTRTVWVGQREPGEEVFGVLVGKIEKAQNIHPGRGIELDRARPTQKLEMRRKAKDPIALLIGVNENIAVVLHRRLHVQQQDAIHQLRQSIPVGPAPKQKKACDE